MRIRSDGSHFSPQKVELSVDEPGLDFAQARKIATTEARRLSSDAMLLSWNDRERGACYPKFECGSRERPAWVVFAESRGGNLRIEINKGQFTFIFLLL